MQNRIDVYWHLHRYRTVQVHWNFCAFLPESSLTEGAGSYYHLTHSELVALLLQREAELERQKPQVKDLEDYIDTLLVRIMEQKPTLLQVRSKLK
uniref:FIP-RBD domain-containing protein n=1 Tax=Labrus bergylta TaxID=56723 RepID=A0A3Q3EN93_9LABR